MSPSTSNVNAGPIELIPTLVAGVPCTLTIVAPKPTFNKLVVVIPATYAFPAVAKPSVAIPVTFKLRPVNSSRLISPETTKLPPI